jgi:hypothetical protein
MPELRTALHYHHQAVQGFLARAEAVSPEEWLKPRAEGKWSPGQVVEHVALSYESSNDVLHHRVPGSGAPRLLRPLLRALLLRPVLRLQGFPFAGKSPAVLRPGPVPTERSKLLGRLEGAARAFERDSNAAESGTVDHPAFGRLPLVDLIQFQQIHTNHHAGQLPPTGRESRRR